MQNRVVILPSDVDMAWDRMEAGRRAWTVPGVFDVANCLTVHEALQIQREPVEPDGGDACNLSRTRSS